MSIQHALDELKRSKKHKVEPPPMTHVDFSISDEREQSDVIKDNHHTVWIKAPDGKTVKRHKIKHNVMVI